MSLSLVLDSEKDAFDGADKQIITCLEPDTQSLGLEPHLVFIGLDSGLHSQDLRLTCKTVITKTYQAAQTL